MFPEYHTKVRDQATPILHPLLSHLYSHQEFSFLSKKTKKKKKEIGKIQVAYKDYIFLQPAYPLLPTIPGTVTEIYE